VTTPAGVQPEIVARFDDQFHRSLRNIADRLDRSDQCQTLQK